MGRPLRYVVVAIGALLGCHSPTASRCSRGALCALSPTLFVTGHVRASVNPLPGVLVTVSAYQGGCTGSVVPLLPSPTEAVTDAQGLYHVGLEPTMPAAAACIRVAYSQALSADTDGVALRLPPAVPETVHVDLAGP